MKLNKYQDKSMSKRKLLLISLGTIALISVSLLLYKTFASFNEHVEFPIMNGKVDYFGNSDVYFAFYNDNEKLDSMPLKDNDDGILFSHGVCDNGASIEWNESEWAPLVKNLSKSKTKCSLYFGKPKELGKDILPVESGDGLYKVEHNDLEELGQEWNKTEYRYAGTNPNNYVSFNNEIWRIIGLVNVKTDSGIEQRVKIIRVDGIDGQKDFGNYSWDRDESQSYTNNWTTSKLKDMLNGIYYESETGECFKDGKTGECNYNSEIDLPKGLNEVSKNMVDKEVSWNIGGSNTYNNVTVKMFYERERGDNTSNGNTYPSEWSNETEVGDNHNGIGIIYPSDYGYATNGGNLGRKKCFEQILYDWDITSENYQNDCAGTDWLKPNIGSLWTITPYSSISISSFYISSPGDVGSHGVYISRGIWPTLYLTTSTKIVYGDGTLENPYHLTVK